MKLVQVVIASVVWLAGASLAGGAAPEKPEGKASGAKPSSMGPLIDRTSRPSRVDAAECVNKGTAACALTVRVSAGVKKEGGDKAGACSISVSPDALFVRDKGATVLVWQVESGVWMFPERDGIKFKQEGAPFFDGHRAGERRWQVVHRPTQPGVHRYGVNLVDAKGRTCTLDPVIVDDW